MPFHGRCRSALAVAGAWLLAWLVISCLPAAALASAAAVSVFPIPGSRLATPQTQITFRGISAAQLEGTTIKVNGTSSGAHSGKVLIDSDGQGGSFLPDQPFTPGEVVTVNTSLNILRGNGGSFQFTIAVPAGRVPFRVRPSAPRVRGDVWRFASRPDLVPAALRMRRRGAVAPGDLFLAPQLGPVQDGPMIVNSRDQLVWFNPLPRNDSASDFRVQRYQGQPVLTWWQGNVNAGVGSGEDVIYDSSYRHIATISAGNGLLADLHECQISPQNTAWISAYFPVWWDASSVHGLKRQIVLDAVVQEIDIATGLVMFQWDSLDHVNLTASYMGVPAGNVSTFRAPFDYFHLNSIDLDSDGTLIISARNTSAVYKLNPATGAIIWTLGGRHSSFRMGPGASFGFQHDARVRAPGDRVISMFDDATGPPGFRSQSRGLKLLLNFKRHTAREVAQLQHSPPLHTLVEGNFEALPNGGALIGWGSRPYLTEYNRHGHWVLDARIPSKNLNYRAYKFRWTGTPITPPALAAAAHGRKALLYASWNGATEVASWRVLGGASPTGLTGLRTAPKHGFETHIKVPIEQYFEVQALDRSGRVLGASPVVRTG